VLVTAASPASSVVSAAVATVLPVVASPAVAGDEAVDCAVSTSSPFSLPPLVDGAGKLTATPRIQALDIGSPVALDEAATVTARLLVPFELPALPGLLGAGAFAAPHVADVVAAAGLVAVELLGVELVAASAASGAAGFCAAGDCAVDFAGVMTAAGSVVAEELAGLGWAAVAVAPLVEVTLVPVVRLVLLTTVGTLGAAASAFAVGDLLAAALWLAAGADDVDGADGFDAGAELAAVLAVPAPTGLLRLASTSEKLPPPLALLPANTDAAPRAGAVSATVLTGTRALIPHPAGAARAHRVRVVRGALRPSAPPSEPCR
jgi:hypothetical protein